MKRLTKTADSSILSVFLLSSTIMLMIGIVKLVSIEDVIGDYQQRNIIHININEDVQERNQEVLGPPHIVDRPANTQKIDVQLLARLINSESIGENLADKLLVGSVVLNRIADPRFPGTMTEVIYQKNQFSGIYTNWFRYSKKTRGDRESIKAAEILASYGPVDSTILYFLNPETSTNTRWVNTIENHFQLVVSGRHHDFYTDAVQ